MGKPDASFQQQTVDAAHFQLAMTSLEINIENPEPIITTSRQFAVGLSLTRLAAEFGVDEASLQLDLRRLQDLIDISFGRLLNDGLLSRDSLGSSYKQALCLLLKNSKEEPDEPECAQFDQLDTDETSGSTGGDATDTDPTTGAG